MSACRRARAGISYVFVLDAHERCTYEPVYAWNLSHTRPSRAPRSHPPHPVHLPAPPRLLPFYSQQTRVELDNGPCAAPRAPVLALHESGGEPRGHSDARAMRSSADSRSVHGASTYRRSRAAVRPADVCVFRRYRGDDSPSASRAVRDFSYSAKIKIHRSDCTFTPSAVSGSRTRALGRCTRHVPRVLSRTDTGIFALAIGSRVGMFAAGVLLTTGTPVSLETTIVLCGTVPLLITCAGFPVVAPPRRARRWFPNHKDDAFYMVTARPRLSPVNSLTTHAMYVSSTIMPAPPPLSTPFASPSSATYLHPALSPGSRAAPRACCRARDHHQRLAHPVLQTWIHNRRLTSPAQGGPTRRARAARARRPSPRPLPAAAGVSVFRAHARADGDVDARRRRRAA
ncbi:hypothetical protein A0H81_14027 [Grifola frondosa]|uniref:Uncharacterized protein n=1 Tax=Grifola frondosa TaxID=5627 RepID=A0A1C7LP49_GRIFR|nr:hypothetical protein A0H81_14027 [Grifola frondosa]